VATSIREQAMESLPKAKKSLKITSTNGEEKGKFSHFSLRGVG